MHTLSVAAIRKPLCHMELRSCTVFHDTTTCSPRFKLCRLALSRAHGRHRSSTWVWFILYYPLPYGGYIFEPHYHAQPIWSGLQQSLQLHPDLPCDRAPDALMPTPVLTPPATSVVPSPRLRTSLTHISVHRCPHRTTCCVWAVTSSTAAACT